MATFFPRNVFDTEASLTPLFRLLDDFDSYSRQCRSESVSPSNNNNNNNSSTTTNNGRGATKSQQQQPQNRLANSFSRWQPKFDVRETAEAYELYGELPGLARDQVNIEFTEPQTLVVCGKVERTDTTTSSSPAYQASVADDDEDEDDTRSAASSTTPAPATAVTTTTAKSQGGNGQVKHLLTERSVGEFVRSFSFPSRVNQEAVRAGLQDGILSISVPKAKKHETVRISVN